MNRQHDIQLSSVYIQQENSAGCVVACAAMLISNYRIATGQPAETYANVKAANVGGKGTVDKGSEGATSIADVAPFTAAPFPTTFALKF